MQMRFSSIFDYSEFVGKMDVESSVVIEHRASKMISLEKHLATNL